MCRCSVFRPWISVDLLDFLGHAILDQTRLVNISMMEIVLALKVICIGLRPFVPCLLCNWS